MGAWAVDVLAAALVIAAGASFAGTMRALTDADDLRAIYWFLVGTTCLAAGVRLARRRAGV